MISSKSSKVLVLTQSWILEKVLVSGLPGQVIDVVKVLHGVSLETALNPP